MNIQELQERHYEIVMDGVDEGKNKYYTHAELSIQFAIEMLEELDNHINSSEAEVTWWYSMQIENKIEELKKYL